MGTYIIKNGMIVNRGLIYPSDILIKDGKIEKMDHIIDHNGAIEIDAKDKYIIPGIIDDQVHFREPGLTHKANIYSEAKAGIAGGVTSFMEMPNTKPSALTQELLQDKYDIAANSSLANYSFYMGASNDNLDEVLKSDSNAICGIKVFMGSSTGNMLVDDEEVLDKIFSKAHMLVATHCEDEARVRARTREYVDKYGDDMPMHLHPIIRDEKTCYLSSSKAVELARKYNTKLHILHISTGKELELFDNELPLSEKRITAEVCVHHLSFNASQYDELGSKIKCNPAIKSIENQEQLLPALLNDKLDVVATDHAPHTFEEKQNIYTKCPSGLPLLQHSLQMMLRFYFDNQISLDRIVEKMCHAPSILFQVKNRGFIDEGAWADLVILDLERSQTVTKENIHYKCGWSPLEGMELKGVIDKTFVNGNIVYNDGIFKEDTKGMRLEFTRY
jgi:dihydroorotase